MLFTLFSVIMCPGMSIVNGMVTYSAGSTAPYNYGTVATYTCNSGYFLSGIATRTCSGDGSSVTGAFSGVDPFCTRTLVYIQIMTVYVYYY